MQSPETTSGALRRQSRGSTQLQLQANRADRPEPQATRARKLHPQQSTAPDCAMTAAAVRPLSLRVTRAPLVHLLLAALVSLLAILAITQSLSECHPMKRTQYHEQGLHGPKSYKFGYTSGDHKNPQERHEVSDGKGHVKGWYSFVDGAGKHQVVHYEAHPKHGFKIINHKKAHNNGKRHYNS